MMISQLFIPYTKMGDALGMGLGEAMKKSDDIEDVNYEYNNSSEYVATFWPEILYDNDNYFDFF